MLIRHSLRGALLFSIAVPILQAGRTLLWGHWPLWQQIPIEADGYLAGAFQLGTLVAAGRGWVPLRPALAAGWGVWCGILYRTFTEQLADPARHAGHEVLVLTIKGLLLVTAALGLAFALAREDTKRTGE